MRTDRLFGISAALRLPLPRRLFLSLYLYSCARRLLAGSHSIRPWRVPHAFLLAVSSRYSPYSITWRSADAGTSAGYVRWQMWSYKLYLLLVSSPLHSWPHDKKCAHLKSSTELYSSESATYR